MLALFESLWSLLIHIFTVLTRSLITACLIWSFFSYMGWIRRIVWFWLEFSLTDAANGAPITVGSLHLQILRGKIVLTNVIVHTPQRDLWKWESPLIARVGRVEAEWNMYSIFEQLLHGTHPKKLKVDLYSVDVSDIQFFLERRQHVFNFYMLDKLMELPDPKQVVAAAEEEQNNLTTRRAMDSQQSDDPLEEDESEAQELVHQMFSAVQSLGRQAQRSGGWKGALKRQRRTLTSKLREMQQDPNNSLLEGGRVLKQVGKAVVQTKATAAIPKRRPPSEPPVFVRVGRILLQEGRVFTREGSRWAKPIYLSQVWLRAAELCPPMSLLDEYGKPALYQPIDKVAEVVIKRLLAETAKTQTGRLLNTAVGEAVGLVKLETAA